MSEDNKEIEKNEKTEEIEETEDNKETEVTEDIEDIKEKEPKEEIGEKDNRPDMAGALFEDDASEAEPIKRESVFSKKLFSFKSFLLAGVALVLATVMVSFVTFDSVYRAKRAEDLDGVLINGGQTSGGKPDTFDIVKALLGQNALADFDEDINTDLAIKYYVYASGDRYAEYYTDEELEMIQASNSGVNVGVGINIIETFVTVDGVEYRAIRVVGVVENTPAEAAGVKTGDYIFWVGTGDDRELVADLGYSVALSKLRGALGTDAVFTVLRPDGDGFEEVEFTINRVEFVSPSVKGRVCAEDEDVGIIRIEQFISTTPAEFSKAMDELIEKGCDRFVFDVRNNPGGELRSISAVLSYFLEEGDRILSTKDKQGNEEFYTVEEVEYSGDYADCSVGAEDIGKYRGYEYAVLCNSSTASAAELFTAAFRDYELCDVFGTVTFGKGSMQTMLPLYYYGGEGALKYTDRYYFPPSGEGYDGIGITPDVEVKLTDSGVSIYELEDKDDDQLMAAVKSFKE